MALVLQGSEQNLGREQTQIHRSYPPRFPAVQRLSVSMLLLVAPAQEFLVRNADWAGRARDTVVVVVQSAALAPLSPTERNFLRRSHAGAREVQITFVRSSRVFQAAIGRAANVDEIVLRLVPRLEVPVG